MQSKFEKHMGNRGLPPKVSNNMYKSVSDYRKAALENEAERGLFRDGNSPSGSLKEDNHAPTVMGNIISSGHIKTAQSSSTSTTGSQWRGGNGESLRQTPEVYSPLWLNSNLNLPRDRATINAWCRSFYALNPIVQNAINLHSTYPISKLNIRSPNKKVEKFFNEMIEETDMMNICTQIAQEYFLLGEAFPYAELDESNAKWSRLILQNPDYIVVKRSVIASEPIIMLRPDENLKKIVFSNKPSDVAQRQQLNENIIEHIKRGENIPLDNFYISHIARRISPYEARGTGLPVCAFRQLMLFDKLRECKFAQADNLVNPLTIVKIGSADYKPTFGDLEAWREVFSQAQYDKDFKIFTHEGVVVERVGAGQAIYDTSGDITQLLKEIYSGLMVPSAVMDGGQDTTYANAGVALDILRQRYMTFRNMLSSWLKRKIFAPISKLNEFYEYVENEKVLIVPEVEWNHMSLFDAGDYIQNIMQMLDKKAVSRQTVYKSFGLEYEEEQRKLRKEAIATAIAEKEAASLKSMPLNELRTLSDDDEIPEVMDAPVPGESASDMSGAMPTGAPEEAGGGMGGGMGGGPPALPPLPGISEAAPPPPAT